MHLVYWALGVIICAFTGSFLAGYMTEKGKNLATHEDIDKVLDQVRRVTSTTEEIKGKISSDLWDRQKQWELKREMIIGVSNAMSGIEEALLHLSSTIRVMKLEDAGWKEAYHGALQKWHKACAAFDPARLLVTIVCSRDTAEAVHQYGKSAFILGAGLTGGRDANVYDDSFKELGLKYEKVRGALRIELGIKETEAQ